MDDNENEGSPNAGHMLTTVDNPFDPVTEFKQWYTWDATAGYHTLGYLARIAITSDELSDAEQDLALEDAMDEIIRMHDGGFYKKVPIPA